MIHQIFAPGGNMPMTRRPAPIKNIELPKNEPYLLILFNLFKHRITPTAPKPTEDISQPNRDGLSGKSSRVNTANCASTNWIDINAIKAKEKLATKTLDRNITPQPF